MKMSNYQQEIKRTLNTNVVDIKQNMFLGIFGETGEVVDNIKKYLYQGHPEPHYVEELGDLLWYIGNYANALGIELTDELETEYLEDATVIKELVSMLDGLYMLGVTLEGTPDKLLGQGRALKHIYMTVKRICYLLNLDIGRVRKYNVDKLFLRYPNGFDAERSVNR